MRYTLATPCHCQMSPPATDFIRHYSMRAYAMLMLRFSRLLPRQPPFHA